MTQERIIIEGVVEGMKFSKTMTVALDPETESIEDAIIRFFNSQVHSFEELAVSRGWKESYWTYPLEDGLAL
ncbi:hypothetical protein [Thalassobacillus sp. CUG 92003]|uniref:hypothetical protein n=1 Tax=Thalassobacillus sp. CUG 92003 TaxID=2736641 RepID=UPI0015E66B87|nr:hypothetical protein [Thalassobacillus sp. CUG 92003]